MLENGDEAEKDLAKIMTLMKGLFMVTVQILAWETFFEKIYPHLIDKKVIPPERLGKDWLQIMNKSVESINQRVFEPKEDCEE